MKPLIITLLLVTLITRSYGHKYHTCTNGDDGEAVDCRDKFSVDNNAALLMTCNETFCGNEKTGGNNAYNNVERVCGNECEENNFDGPVVGLLLFSATIPMVLLLGSRLRSYISAVCVAIVGTRMLTLPP